MLRNRDWRTRLRAYATSQLGRPFKWGATDCGTLAQQSLIAMFGPAIDARLPAALDSPRDAVEVLESIGSIEALFAELGAEIVTNPRFVRAGDIIMLEEPDESVGQVALMVCLDGTECLMTSAEGGVQTTDLRHHATDNMRAFSLWETIDG